MKTVDSLGLGTYQFWVNGAIDALGANDKMLSGYPGVVFAVFSYPTDYSLDGHDEIDMEFSHWGTHSTNADYNVWPKEGSDPPNTVNNFNLNLDGAWTTLRYARGANDVWFNIYGDHVAPACNPVSYKYWDYNENDISTTKMPVHINFFNFTDPPDDMNEIEVVINKFTFIPAGHSLGACP